jgi:hypothetical protein
MSDQESRSPRWYLGGFLPLGRPEARVPSVARMIAIVAAFMSATALDIRPAVADDGMTVQVSLAHKGTVTRSGIASVTATVTCSEPTTYAETFISLIQRVHGIRIDTFQDGDVPNDCGPSPRTFQVSVADYENESAPLHPGRAIVDLEIFACADIDVLDDCAWGGASRTIILTGSHG